MSTATMLGIVYIMLGNLLWALPFLVPKVLPSYSAFEITLGRYLMYGLFSLGAFVFYSPMRLREVQRGVWRKAILFAFCGNLGYYFFLVLAIQLMGAAIPTLVLGVLPITIALYGNYLHREFSPREVVPSLLAILFGIIVMNVPNMGGLVGNATGRGMAGLVCSIIALGLWTWYAVANAQFLKDHPQVSAENWASITGIGTLMLFPFLVGGTMYFDASVIDLARIFRVDSSNLFWSICFILGFLVSWAGTILWNKATHLLPLALAGQLLVGETVFGLGYIYIFDFTIPSLAEGIGIIITILGVLYGLRNAGKDEGRTCYDFANDAK